MSVDPGFTIEDIDSACGAVASCIRGNLVNPRLTGVFGGEAPNGTDFPYITVNLPKTKFQWTMEKHTIEKPIIHLALYHTNFFLAEGGMRRIMADLLDRDLPKLNGRVLQLFPDDLYMKIDRNLSAGSKLVHVATMPLELWVGR